jgi:hypothetical protein
MDTLAGKVAKYALKSDDEEGSVHETHAAGKELTLGLAVGFGRAG